MGALSRIKTDYCSAFSVIICALLQLVAQLVKWLICCPCYCVGKHTNDSVNLFYCVYLAADSLIMRFDQLICIVLKW